MSGERSLASLIGYNGHLVRIQDRVETAPLPAFSTVISLHEVALNSVHRFSSAHDESGAKRGNGYSPWFDWGALSCCDP